MHHVGIASCQIREPFAVKAAVSTSCDVSYMKAL